MIFLYVFWWVGTTQVLNVIRNITLTYFLGSAFLMIISYVLKYFRWVILVRERHKSITNTQLFVVHAVSYGLSVSLPSKTGDVVGLEVTRRYAGIPIGDAVSILAFYRIYDIGSIIIAAAVSSLFYSDVRSIGWLKPVLFVSALLFIFLLTLFLIPSTSEKISNLILRLMDRFFSGHAKTFRNDIRGILDDYLETVQAYSEKKSILISIMGLTGIRWIFEFLSFNLLLRSVGIDKGFGISVLLVSIRVIFSVITLIPFGLGTSLIPTLAIFDLLGVAKAAGVAVDILSNLLGPILTAGIGLVCTSFLRENNNRSNRSESSIISDNQELE